MKTPTNLWVQRLTGSEEDRSCALTELRGLLVARVTHAFHHNTIVDSSFVEDVVQDTLLKIMNSIGQFEGRSLFETWATTIAIRFAYTELRKRRWKDLSLDKLVELNDEFVPEPEQSNDPNQQERQGFIKAMYEVIHEKLSQKQRTALLAELAEIPMEEIGRRLGSNRNAIYKLTHDARKKLRQGLEQAGFTEADFVNLQERN